MGIRSTWQAWKRLPSMEKVNLGTEMATAVGAVAALAISIVSISVSVSASNKASSNEELANRLAGMAYANDRITNRLATAYRVAWHVPEEGNGARHLLIENRSLVPAYRVLLLDATANRLYKISVLGPCTQFSVDPPDGIKFDQFTMHFHTAGQWYKTDANGKTVPSKISEKTFADYKDHKDTAQTSKQKPMFEDLQGCG
ncbi:hypothetical protein SGFS_058430 [Streptomyces graminofaciens]|uniref:Uncharacterized protein n=1 Tax=Streptomyces graminofaciens TaxID=68212 RepID=A0ABM7FEM6_9ACTN|nr:hypothetical protein [Streptomyces graminofaciens]BBC34549.1 hypothetical protein SGFS_058430 [Streptomyces graminofaciens]